MRRRFHRARVIFPGEVPNGWIIRAEKYPVKNKRGHWVYENADICIPPGYRISAPLSDGPVVVIDKKKSRTMANIWPNPDEVL